MKRISFAILGTLSALLLSSCSFFSSNKATCGLPIKDYTEFGNIDWNQVNPDGVDYECADSLYEAYESWRYEHPTSSQEKPQTSDIQLSSEPLETDPFIYGSSDGGESYTITSIRDGVVFASPLEIPSTREGKPVKYIADNAFKNRTDLGKIILGEGLVSIGEYAFSGSSITSIAFPSTLTNIGKFAFAGCSSLSEITFGDSLYEVGEYAFQGCGFEEIEIPKIDRLGRYAFCENTKEATFTIHGTGDFSSTFAKINAKKVILAEGVTSLTGSCFYGSTIKDIVLPSTFTSIGSRAFELVSGLPASFYDLPDSVTFIGSYAFRGLEGNGNTLKLGSVETIEEGAFYEANNLTLDFEEASIDFSRGVLAGFAGNVLVSSTNPSLSRDGNGNLYTKNYQTILLSRTGLSSFHPDCKAIGPGVFRGQYGVGGTSQISIPDQIEVIGDRAFDSCMGLTSVNLNRVKKVSDWAFWCCSALSSVSRASGFLKEIGGSAFGLTALASFDFSGIENLGGCAFTGAPLTSVNLPSSLVSLGEGCFQQCRELTRADFSQTQLTTFPSNAVDYCLSLSSLSLPPNATTVNGSFLNTKLSSLSWPSTLDYLGMYALSGLNGSSDFSKTNLKVIAPWAAIYCKASSFTFPATLISIGERAFAECKNLNRINFLGTMAQWQAIIKGEAIFALVGRNITIACIDGNLTEYGG